MFILEIHRGKSGHKWLAIRYREFLHLRRLKSHEPLYALYSEACLKRPLPLEITCLDRPHIFVRRTYISISLNLSPETTCLDRPHFCGQWGGLSRQVLLYLCTVDLPQVDHIDPFGPVFQTGNVAGRSGNTKAL